MDIYNLKGKSKRLELKLLSQINNPIPAIDLTLVLKKLYSLYYKTDLIESLATLLSTGINPRNFLISQKSVKDSLSIKNKPILNFIQDSDILYKHGFFHALFPSKNIIKLDISSKCFKDLNSLLHNFDCKTIYTRKLRDLIPLSNDDDFQKGLNFLYDISIEMNKTKIERNEYIKNGIKNVINSTQIKYIAFNTDEEKIIELSDYINDNSERELKDQEKSIIKKYFDPFFDSFLNNDFPILYFMDINDLNVLSHYHFNENSFNNPFYFDLKSITHNSPVSIVIEAAQNYIMPLLIAYLSFLGFQKTFFETKKVQLETKKLDKNRNNEKTNEKQLEQINELIANYSINEKVFEEKYLSVIERIPSLYFRKKLFDILNIILVEYELLLKDFSLVISENRIIK